MKLLINGDVEISTGAIERYEWERSHYIDGTKSTLVITMVDGTRHRVGGMEAYEVERKLTQGE